MQQTYNQSAIRDSTDQRIRSDSTVTTTDIESGYQQSDSKSIT